MEENLKLFAEKLKNLKSLYTAGGIQNRKNPDGWRQDLVKFFGNNNVQVINPYADNQEIFNQSVMGYNEDGKPYTMNDLLTIDHEKRIMLYRQTELNDMYFMANVDLQVFYLDESAGFGTWTEFKENYQIFKKPCIIIRRMPIEKFPHWIEWRYFKILQVGNAIEFKNFPEMKKFFIEYLNYKEK
jgi:hypothetical protein